MSDRILKRLAHTALVSLLLSTALAVATALTWAHAPAFVDGVGEQLASRHVRVRQRQLNDAVQELRKDGPKGIASLEALLAELEAVRRGDRLTGVKDSAFSHWTHGLEAEGRLLDAAQGYDTWVAYDERNLIASARRAALLYRLPTRREEGFAAMAALQARVPEAPDVAGRYAGMLIDSGDRIEAFLVLLEQAALGRSGSERFARASWFIYWKDEQEFSGERRVSLSLEVQPDGRFEASFPVPPGTLQLRLDAPPDLPLILFEPVLLLVGKERSERVNIWEQPLRLHDVENLGLALRTWGSDPYAVWSAAVSEEGITGTLSGRLQAAVDERILALLSSGESLAVERALEARGAASAARELRVLHREMADLNGPGVVR